MSGLHTLGLIIGLIAIVFGCIHIIKYRYRVFRSEHLQRVRKSGIKQDVYPGLRQYPQVDVFAHRALFFQMGLLISIVFVYGLMEWTNPEHRPSTRPGEENYVDILDLEDIPLTTHKRPPLPRVPVEWREIIPDTDIHTALVEEEFPPVEKVISTSLENGDALANRDARLTPVVQPVMPDEEDRLWVVAEDMPRFPGCEDLPSKKDREACARQALLAFIYGHIQYPAMASKNGIEGTTVVSFIVETDGSVQSAKVVREIGGGCGQEALRVIELMNAKGLRWIAGRQLGRPVRVQFNLPVKFRLH